jgi:hypothetical protein
MATQKKKNSMTYPTLRTDYWSIGNRILAPNRIMQAAKVHCRLQV